jgi:hypothetical protein
LKVEDRGVNRLEALGWSGRFEACIFRSCRRVGWCEFSARLFLRNPCSCRAVRPQLVGHRHIGREALFLEQLADQFHRCSFIAPPFREQVENLAFVVNRTP